MCENFPSRELKEQLYRKIRRKIPDEDATVMIQTSVSAESKNTILVSLSPNIVDKSPQLPKTIDIFDVFYRELEPFNYSKEIDKVL